MLNYDRSTFFDLYQPLTTDYISKALKEAPKPKGGVDTDQFADNNMTIILDDGGKLVYKLSPETLTLAENGGDAVAAPYAIQYLDGVTLMSHLIPGTLRCLNVIIDEVTNIVTVFETWFGGYERAPREVWRDIRKGYIDHGQAAPTERHELTNRVEGLGTHWKTDDGNEVLYFFPSVVWSSYVELSHPRGGITITAPSDYLKINDHQYIYSRAEQEYSGSFTLEVFDLFEFKNIGVRIGFTLEDALDYTVYSGEGTVTGRYAQLEPLTDYGTKIPFEEGMQKMLDNGPKGIRPSYRPRILHDDHSPEEVEEIIRTKARFFDGGTIMSSKNTMEESGYLTGKTFTLRYDDGSAWEYSFIDAETLKWRAEGEAEWTQDNYRAYEPAKDLLLFAHICTDSRPLRNLTHAIDFKNALATCVDAVMGSSRKAWEVSNRAIFGVAEGIGLEIPAVARHGFTTELVGKAFSWTYSDWMQSIHVYSSPESYSWTIMMPDNTGGVMWSSPCLYVKLRDEVYLMSWTEDTCNGNQGTFVLNTNIMHDAGFFYGIGGNAGGEADVHLDPLGAYCRQLGSYDITKYFTR